MSYACTDACTDTVPYAGTNSFSNSVSNCMLLFIVDVFFFFIIIKNVFFN